MTLTFPLLATATAVALVLTPPRPVNGEEIVIEVIAQALESAGQALSDPELVDAVVYGGMISAIAVDKISAAGSAFDSAASQLADIKANQLPELSEGVIQTYADLGGALGRAATALQFGLHDDLSLELAGFAGHLPVEFGWEYGTVDAAAVEHELRSARRQALDGGDVAYLIARALTLPGFGAHSFGLETSAELVLAVNGIASRPASELQADADELLAITDQEVIVLADLDDPDLREALANLTWLLQEPDVTDWLDWIGADARGWLVTKSEIGLGASLVLLGWSLDLAGASLSDGLGPASSNTFGYGSAFLKGCPDLCNPEGKKSNCVVSSTALSTGNLNPREHKAIDTALKTLLDVTAALGQSSPGDKQVASAFKALKKLITLRRPTLWIKIWYDVCRSKFCWFTTRLKCVDEETDWCQVKPGPSWYATVFGPGVWPSVSQWKGSVKKDIQKAIDKKLKKTCD